VRHGLHDVRGRLPPRCDVVIVGAGITGALVADALAGAGVAVVVVDRRVPGSGSTAASTALLQYELDLELLQLIEKTGYHRAVRVYQRAAAAIAGFESLVGELGDGCGFARRQSIYLASRRRDIDRLQREAVARVGIGIEARFCNEIEVATEFGLPGHGAIVSPCAAVIDPLRLTRALLDRATTRGAVVVEWTTAILAETAPAGGLLVTTTRGSVLADRIVLACGYEVPPCIEPGMTSLHSTFALVTEPCDDPGPLADRAIVWESARPYSYLRNDGRRMILGGFDLPFRSPALRDAAIPRQTRRLESQLHRWQPDLLARIEYSWAGTFGETDDSMPVIGPVEGTDRIDFALGYGGNGIVFSLIAAELLRDRCLGRVHPDHALFDQRR
jgi:glycine/D-amino acid oxidase-like deaminating enzyme